MPETLGLPKHFQGEVGYIDIFDIVQKGDDDAPDLDSFWRDFMLEYRTPGEEWQRAWVGAAPLIVNDPIHVFRWIVPAGEVIIRRKDETDEFRIPVTPDKITVLWLSGQRPSWGIPKAGWSILGEVPYPGADRACAIDALLALLGSGGWAAKWYAVQVLGEIRATEAEPALRDLAEMTPMLRDHAQAALDAIRVAPPEPAGVCAPSS